MSIVTTAFSYRQFSVDHSYVLFITYYYYYYIIMQRLTRRVGHKDDESQA